MHETILQILQFTHLTCAQQDSQDTPLTVASYLGHKEVVQVLLEAGAHVNHQDKVLYQS